MTTAKFPASKHKMFSPMRKLPFLALSITASIALNAHSSDWLDLQQNDPGVTGYADMNSVADLEQATQSKMDLKKRWVDQRGVEYARWKQMYQGIPIYSETLITRHGVEGDFEATGNALMDLTEEVATMQTTITAEQAVEIVKNRNNNPDSDNYVELVYETDSVITEIVIYRGGPDDSDVEATKAWSVTYLADLAGGGDPRRIHALVDARDGSIIIEPFNMIGQVKQATGPGGNPNRSYTWGSGGLPALTIDDNCNFVNNKVRTIDLNGATNGGNIFRIANCGNNPVNNQRPANGGRSPVNDGHAFGSIVFDMYRAYIGVNPLSFQLLMRVGYGQNFDNAFWNGRAMTFGDGGRVFYPLVSLDVTAHEVSHGFTEQNSGLVYKNQSGGMNEAFSDMAGEAADFFLRRNTDFVTGDDIKKNRRPLRSLRNPRSDGRSIDNINQYRNGMDVHFSSGVYNKAFFNLATTNGWDIPTAFRVFAQANMAYWTPNSTFNRGACGVLRAARDLGRSQVDVANAFDDVGVRCPNINPRPDNGGGNNPNTVALQSGTPVNGISGGRGSRQFYTVEVPQGAGSVQFQLSGGTGDADLYIRRGSRPTTRQFDLRPFRDGNNETVSINNPQAGTYHVMVRGYANFSNTNLVATVSGSGNSTSNAFTNSNLVNIPDANNAGVFSPIDSSLSGDSGVITVDVDITHPWRGDLVLRLVAPDGRSALLENIPNNDSGDNVVKSYTVNASGVQSLGRWLLQVRDLGRADVGTINSWGITFNASATDAGNDIVDDSAPTLDVYDNKSAAPEPGSNPDSGSTPSPSSSSDGGGGGGSAATLGLLVLLSGLLGLRRQRK